MERINLPPISLTGVAESGDDFTKFSTISQCFQTLIHPPLMQRRLFYYDHAKGFDITLSVN